MKIIVKRYTIIVKDKETGEEFTVRTLRSAKDIATYIEESEKDEIGDKVEEAVGEALAQ